MTNANLKSLLSEFKRLGLDEGGGMRLLGDSQTISDNAIRIFEVADADVPAALSWLMRKKINDKLTHGPVEKKL